MLRTRLVALFAAALTYTAAVVVVHGFVVVQPLLPPPKTAAFATTQRGAFLATTTNQQQRVRTATDVVSAHVSLRSSSSSSSSMVQLWASNKQGSGGDTKAQSPNDDAVAKAVAWNFNAIPALAWLGIVAFAVSRPDSADLDANLIRQILDNPTNPGIINELFVFLFNVFLPLPAIVAALLVPQGSPGGTTTTTLPAGPFVAASFGLGYFALGPFLVVRPPPRSVVMDESSISWVTRHVLENKVFGWSLLAILLYLPWAAQLPQAWSVDSGVTVWSDFVELFSSSRLVAVSCVDLTLLHVTAAALIPADYRLRTSTTDKEDRGQLVALAAALFPFVGPALYVALRPKLVVLQEETN
jgi:hypothetical protein